MRKYDKCEFNIGGDFTVDSLLTKFIVVHYGMEVNGGTKERLKGTASKPAAFRLISPSSLKIDTMHLPIHKYEFIKAHKSLFFSDIAISPAHTEG